MRMPIHPKRKIKASDGVKDDGNAEVRLYANISRVVVANFERMRKSSFPRKIESVHPSLLAETIFEVEKAMIWNALVKALFNTSRAARILGVGRHMVTIRARQLGFYESLKNARGAQ